jgi:hypothetical protein
MDKMKSAALTGWGVITLENLRTAVEEPPSPARYFYWAVFLGTLAIFIAIVAAKPPYER